MKVAVIGAGAIGGLVAGYLKKEGQDITLICKPLPVRQPPYNPEGIYTGQAGALQVRLEVQGLNISGVRGNFNIDIPVKEKLDEETDLVILAVKTQDIEGAIKQNEPFIRNSKILTTQNGVKAEDILSKYVDLKNLFSSIVMFGSTYFEVGKVVHNFEGDLIIGKFSDENKEFLKSISEVTSKAFNTKIVDNIKGMKWTKLFVNMNNCLPAVLGKSMQETFADIDICKISISLWKEAKDLVDKLGIDLEDLPTFPVERITGLVNMPLEQAAKIYSGIMTGLSKEPLYGSILQSIKRNRPSEIDYINGEIVQLARSKNLTAPLNKKLVEMVHRIEETKRFFSKEELLSNMVHCLQNKSCILHR